MTQTEMDSDIYSASLPSMQELLARAEQKGREKCVEEIRHIFMTSHPNKLTMAISKWIKEQENE